MKANREVLFQEDNDGQGPTIAEARWPDGWRRVWQPLNASLLDQWMAEGVSEIFLAYRGSWEPAKLYRSIAPA